MYEVCSWTWHTTNDKIAFQHPAVFPEKLAEDHILSWSNKGDTILTQWQVVVLRTLKWQRKTTETILV